MRCSGKKLPILSQTCYFLTVGKSASMSSSWEHLLFICVKNAPVCFIAPWPTNALWHSFEQSHEGFFVHQNIFSSAIPLLKAVLGWEKTSRFAPSGGQLPSLGTTSHCKGVSRAVCVPGVQRACHHEQNVADWDGGLESWTGGLGAAAVVRCQNSCLPT